MKKKWLNFSPAVFTDVSESGLGQQRDLFGGNKEILS